MISQHIVLYTHISPAAFIASANAESLETKAIVSCILSQSAQLEKLWAELTNINTN